MALASNRWVRILGAAFLMYTLSFIDRTNIAMAIPAMRHQLGFTAGAIGFASGIFFVGYLVLQIPAGRLATTWSARKFIFGALVAWGVVSMSTALVGNETMLAFNRFALGVAEGGVLTATIVLIRHWFPRAERARANMIFLVSIPFAGFVASPISGLLLHGLGWRAMFVIEAVPAFVWAGVWWWAIADRPEQADWLAPSEKQALVASLAREAAEERQHFTMPGHWTRALIYPPVLLFAAYNFFALIGSWGFTIWLPSVLASFHIGIREVGWLASLPQLAAIIAMIVFAISSDRFAERKWHMILLTAGAGALMVCEAFLQARGAASITLVVLLLSLSNGLFYGRFGAFWALPSEFLPAELMGVGVAVANGLGNLGGFFGPSIVGTVETASGSFTTGFVFLGLCMIVGSLLAIPIRTFKEMEVPEPVGARP
jgi:MFS family permease